MKYIVKLKNRTFEVEVETENATLVKEYPDGTPASAERILIGPSEAKPAAPTPEPKEKPVSHAANSAPQAKDADGGIVCAPMPGMITEILVSEGQTVSDGDTLMILEAMKMENEIISTCSGTVAKLRVSKGQTVQTGDPLAEIS